VRYLVSTLGIFCVASGLVINWLKSNAYWKCSDLGPRPPWTDRLGLQWVDQHNISNMLGTAFGLSLDSGDMDKFLQTRVDKSLQHWTTTKINYTGRRAVVNNILLSSLLYFLSIWGGTQKGIDRIKTKLTNYLWSGSTNNSHVKIRWSQYCQSRDMGGINLINPKDALVALMSKWVIKACEPGRSNLHHML
jgi:hypothetical protein